MATDHTLSLIEDVLTFYNDPALIARAALRTLTKVSNGEQSISNPTNPLVFLLESACCMTSAAMIKNQVVTRKQYPFAAQTQEDLYAHMSDKDYIGRFALPSKTKFTIMLNEAEVLSRLALDPLTGVRKIVIPKNTEIVAGTTVFSLQYPIVISLQRYGGLKIVWDTAQESPLLSLSSNEVFNEIRTPITVTDLPNNRYLTLVVEAYQFNIISELANINTTGVAGSMAFTDQFYHARAYVQRSDLSWFEIKTTHTDQIYDINTVTLVLKVVGNVLHYALPQIYITAGLLTSKLRIDLYQTKGHLEYDLGGYNVDAFKINWKTIDPREKSIFTAPLDSLNSLQECMVFSDTVVSGGRAQLSFEELRTRWMKNAVGATINPTTFTQLYYALKDKGYEIVNNVDQITGRSFLATRSLPLPDVTSASKSIDKPLFTGAAAGIMTLVTSLTQAASHPGVIDNGVSITLTPKAHYRIVNDAVSIVSAAELAAINSKTPDAKATALTNDNYLHAPYYYVLDSTNNQFSARPYELDNPTIVSKSVFIENDTTQLRVTADSVGIVKTDSGYEITIVTKSSDTYKAISDDAVFAQLAFWSENEIEQAFILGEITGKNSAGERMFKFTLRSSFALTATHQLPILAQIYSAEPHHILARLVDYFDIYFSTTAAPAEGWRSSSIDGKLGVVQLPDNVYAINHERIEVKFGVALTSLWAHSRSVAMEYEYQRYQEDVPMLYEADVYSTDNTGATIAIVEGEVVYNNKLHSAGDPVLDVDGEPVMLHRAGDVIENTGSSPLFIETDTGREMARGVTRYIDLLVVDGLYWWATDAAAKAYREKIVRFMTSWMINDLTSVVPVLRERTDIYFHPKSSIGSLRVMTDNGVQTYLESGQKFFVKLHVPATTFKNLDLRQVLKNTAINIIHACLQETQVAISEIIAKLREGFGNDVIDVSFQATGSMAPYSAFTVMDEGKRFAIKKRLTSLTRTLLVVEDDVTIEFVKHYTS